MWLFDSLRERLRDCFSDVPLLLYNVPLRNIVWTSTWLFNTLRNIFLRNIVGDCLRDYFTVYVMYLYARNIVCERLRDYLIFYVMYLYVILWVIVYVIILQST